MLRDIVSGSGLDGYAIIAMVLFFVSFLAVVVWVYLKSRAQTDREARLPLDDDPPVAPPHGHRGNAAGHRHE